MKNRKNACCSLAALILCLCSFAACDPLDGLVTAIVPTNSASSYSVSLPASLTDYTPTTKSVVFAKDGTSIGNIFDSSDKIYVYLERGGAIIGMAHNGKDDFVTLSPTAINGKLATLSGTLAFFKEMEDEEGNVSYTSVPAAVGDILHLFYRMGDPDTEPVFSSFFFKPQDGSSSSAAALDYAIAYMMIAGIDAQSGNMLSLVQVNNTSKTTAEFEALGSMFRRRLAFKDQHNNAVSPNIQEVTVTAGNGSAVIRYAPLAPNKYERDVYHIANDNKNVYDASGDMFFAMMFNYDSDHGTAGDHLVFFAQDDNENYYQGSLGAPEGGFSNGKYYYGDTDMLWQWQRIKPTLLGTEAQPDESDWYNIEETFVRIQNRSFGYVINMVNNSTVTMEYLTAGHTPGTDEFLTAPAANLSLLLDGDNTIQNGNAEKAIYVYGGLSLGCFMGDSSATLTVTAGSADYCGIRSLGSYDSSNNRHDKTEEEDVSDLLAAEYYTVTRSARTDNEDGTFTWTYTVKHK